MNIPINLYPRDKIENMSKYGGYTMDSNFITLFDSVERIRQKQEERERIRKDIAGIKQNAAACYSHIAEEYRGKENKYDEQISKADTENQENKRRITELIRQQIQAETAGEPFEMAAELDRLKAEVATYPQKVEALQSLKDEVYIPAADVEKIEGFLREWQELKNSIRPVEDAIQNELISIREKAIPYCMATFEIIPGLDGFLPDDVNRDFETMRKEPSNEE